MVSGEVDADAPGTRNQFVSGSRRVGTTDRIAIYVADTGAGPHADGYCGLWIGARLR